MATRNDLKSEQKKLDKTICDDYDVMDEHAYAHALGDLSKEQLEEVSRLEFSSKTKRVLAQRVGYHCSNPNCKVASTIGPSDKANGVVLLGEAAHIIGAIQNGDNRLSPRADPTKSISEIVSLENGIWLCRNCHKLVDSKMESYGIEQLRTWKANAEAAQAKRLEDQPPTFVEDYIYPSISVTKGISTEKFETKEWCLLAFMMDKYEYTQALRFDQDDSGVNFSSAYLSWMSENAIDPKIAKIDFDQSWSFVHSSLRNIVNVLTGLVSMNNQGLAYGKEFDKFYEQIIATDDQAVEKLIKKLSKI